MKNEINVDLASAINQWIDVYISTLSNCRNWRWQTQTFVTYQNRLFSNYRRKWIQNHFD